MKTLNRFITEKLKITKNIKVIDNNDKIIEQILDGFSIQLNRYKSNKTIYKNIISDWIYENNIKEIEGPYVIKPSNKKIEKILPSYLINSYMNGDKLLTSFARLLRLQLDDNDHYIYMYTCKEAICISDGDGTIILYTKNN